ncbi:MAG TPA: winged helix-turn-helix domain-containing protein [Thermoanaerobaculia bacterium]|jgi:predicted nucleotidyltransferase|nr:winged helix-turn-helix domain-containing protein [Thermoanaerobaculia bacterium]
MRKRSAADALFPAVRQGVLGVTFRDPARWWYLSELANALDTSPSSLQREVDALTSTGILEKRVDGRRTYYRAHAKSALFDELRGIVTKTMGVPAEIHAALAPLASRITLAMIYGSVARGTDRADSDVDVLVVSDDVMLEELYRRLARAERKLGRKVNPTLYTTEEFRRKRNSNPFLKKVLSRERVLLIGSEDDVSGAR